MGVTYNLDPIVEVMDHTMAAIAKICDIQ